jgi:hypothetical protein
MQNMSKSNQREFPANHNLGSLKRFLILILAFTLFIPTQFSLMSPASAAKTGSACKKLNSKGWDGDNPIVCKKNKSGKLVWTKFNSATNTTPASSKYKIAINLAEVNETLGSSDSRAVGYCNDGGYKYKDIGATTGVEIRDGNGNLLATGVLGSATVIDVPGQALGTCSYAPVLEVKKSDFYQIKIGTRYDKSFSFADLEKVNWKITLFIGS